MTGNMTAAEILIGEVCRCGEEKLAGRVFCFKCWCDLLPSLQMVIWKSMRAGSMAEYEEACRWLDR